MPTLFLSHSSQEDGFVRALQQALAYHGQEVWIDSRELKGGDPLESTLHAAIERADAYALLVSPAALQSKWVGKELRHALQVQQARGHERFPIIPLSLDGTQLGVLEAQFDEEPIYVAVDNSPAGIDAAVHPILVALGQRLPADHPTAPQPKAEPVEELLLELTDLGFRQRDGAPRASAQAELIYEPADRDQERVVSNQPWRLVAPVGPIELNEIRWYLEEYPIWPSEPFRPRAEQVEQGLEEWGQLLYQAAFPSEHTGNVREAWARISDNARRRFSVFIKARPVAGSSEKRSDQAQEAATTLLSLPWELLHDGQGFLFHGARATRVRRRLPRTESFPVPTVAPPIRILLITARPEDDACAYIDHRVSAEPLVAAMEQLGGLVELTLLEPPTLPQLHQALEAARRAERPYHVVHFDGHGVYDRQVGLGGLCFEEPEETAKLSQRRHQTLYSDTLAPLLRDYRIPLVFLEACQGAQAEQANESVASELLKLGVASVVAMSHSVLVESARRFVQAFYQALAGGQRVGDAMLAGQRVLHLDPRRGQIFGAGELRLHDWFVPVLFQERADPQLFTALPAPHTRQDRETRRQAQQGALPAPPATTGFIGRSRELLALERRLLTAPYALLRGQGGEGKTALACELARWWHRTGRIDRIAFCSVEENGHPAAVLDSLGRQLVGEEYSVATFPDQAQALLPLERALTEQRALLIIDNLESILPPPYLAAETPDALQAEAQQALTEILALCRRLNAQGATRLLLTSREPLPAPFADDRNRLELHRLATADAVQLIEKGLHEGDGNTGLEDAAREPIEQLVEAVQGHARTLALLAPSLRQFGVEQTRERLVGLMAEMHERHPTSREQSLFASVELSLQRLSPENRARMRVLGLFHGGVHPAALHLLMEWPKHEIDELTTELVATGLATLGPYNHLALNPALCPHLRAGLTEPELADWGPRWRAAMGQYVAFLRQQARTKAEIAATLTRRELANLFGLLEQTQAQGDPAATIDLTTSLYELLQWLGRPRLLTRLGQVRDAAAQALSEAEGPAPTGAEGSPLSGAEGGWSHALFEAQRTRIDQQLASGQLREALTGAQTLLQRAQAAGPTAYPEADYDLAMAHWLLARVLQSAGGAEAALPLLEQARQGFENITAQEDDLAAARMASVCLTEQADCLSDLGRYDEAVAAYRENISRAEDLNDERQVAVGQGQLGSVYLQQGQHDQALAAYQTARDRFEALGEPGSVAVIWHQIGRTHQAARQPEAGEAAYRHALAINVQQGNLAGQASTLGQLGNLYLDLLARPEEAVTFYRQAADAYEALGDGAKEGAVRNNLAETLRRLHRLDEARQEITRAIECKAEYGHAALPWTSWAILAEIEGDAGHPEAAAEARSRAIAAYRAYRRDGGENHSAAGRLAHAVTQQLQAGHPDQAQALLQQQAERYEAAGYGAYIQALRAICAGKRDPHLAADPALDYDDAAELLHLLDTLAP